MKNLFLIFAVSLLFCNCETKEKENEPFQMPVEEIAPENSNPVAANAPADLPQELAGRNEIKSLEEELAPIIEKARATLPDAKKRLAKGLKMGEAFFLTINWREGKIAERIFVRITKWKGNAITGTIANDIAVLRGYKNGQQIKFNESEVLDWTFSKQDGTEDGNFIGKYMDNRAR